MKISELELILFGDRTYSMYVTNNPRGVGLRINDMAQAWIDGRHDEVNAWVANRIATKPSIEVETVRKPTKRKSRGMGLRAWGPGKRVINYEKVWELRELGWTLKKIATEVKCSVNQVRLICLKKASESNVQQ